VPASPASGAQTEDPRRSLWPMMVLERDSFLDQLDGLLGEAGRGRGRLVLVRGEAGIGKTTLVQAFAAGRESRFSWGTCDPVVPPRPLAPIVDIAEAAGGPLQDALSVMVRESKKLKTFCPPLELDRHQVISSFIALLRADGGPRVAVVEDLQWADEATLELLRVIGRRMLQLPALVLGTFREEEVDPSHPLSLAMGDIPPGAMTTLRLPPLSEDAVRLLASGTPLDPVRLHAASGGNPFYVTEVVGSGSDELPPSVRDAVWARARRLPPDALAVTRATAVLGQRCEAEVACEVAGVEPAAVDECVARGMLRAEGATVEFRHDLARRAVLEAMAPTERAGLERRALECLMARPGEVDPSRAAHHAVAAKDAAAVLEWARRAGARAAALGAHREARAHYASAMPYRARLPVAERAVLLQALAYECHIGDDPDEATALQEEAIAYVRQTGDTEGEAQALIDLGLFRGWGRGWEPAHEAVSAAIALLEPMPPGACLARSYARLAQVHLIAGHWPDAAEWGERALALAREQGEEQTAVHALNTTGTARHMLGHDDGLGMLEESLRRSLDNELEEDAGRAFNNLITTARDERRYDVVDPYLDEMMTFMEQRDLDQTRRCVVGDLAEVALDRGRWQEAEEMAREVLERGQSSGRLQCLSVAGRLAARRGDGDPWPLLDACLALAIDMKHVESTMEAHAGRAEAAWLAGDLRAAAAETGAGMALATPTTNPWAVGRLVLWAWKLDLPVEGPPAAVRLPEPYALHVAGHPEKAAVAWRTLGCPWDEAVALLDCDEEEELKRALELFRSLGAAPAAALATEKLHSIGARGIARGPRKSTQANPSALTDRELDVLALLGEGLRNAEIASRLVISAKTVDHHVSAILGKLGVRDRYAAGQEAIRLGLTPG
jgi:DNA-binding CsgD family transcriptional regulator/tetratricopeptide (TPR) repeat protein